jgi:hypothetical protein
MVVRVEFPKGVPAGCTQWLRENVGIGNIEDGYANTPLHWVHDNPDYAWFYKREALVLSEHDDSIKYVPTITVKDPELAMLFVLRWSAVND